MELCEQLYSTRAICQTVSNSRFEGLNHFQLEILNQLLLHFPISEC